MGTVRNTSISQHTSSPPASFKKGGKRKVSSSSGGSNGNGSHNNNNKVRRPLQYSDPEDLSVAYALAQDMLDKKLASRDKWQVCTQRMRRELGRLEETIDTVQMQVEDGLSKYDHAYDTIQQLTSDQRKCVDEMRLQMETYTASAQDHKEVTQQQLLKLNKKFDKHLEAQRVMATMVDEETLMTQLSGLQERSENEIATVREEITSQFEAKMQVVVQEMSQKMAALEEIVHRKERDDLASEQRTQETSQQVHDEVSLLQRRVIELEHRESRLTSENGQLKAAFDSSQKQFDSIEDRMEYMARELDQVIRTGGAMAPYPSPLSMAPPPLAPPLPPVPLPVNLGPLEEKLHYVARDVERMADDYLRWKSYAESAHQRLQQEFTGRLDDSREAIFKTLNYDSRKHEFENGRLKDACFDLRSDVANLRQQIVETQMEMQKKWQALAETQAATAAQLHHQSCQSRARSRSRSRSPPFSSRRRQYGRDRALLPPSTSSATTMVRQPYMDAEQQYFGGSWAESDRQQRQTRSRSRSRSPERSPPPVYTTSEMLYIPLNRPNREEDPSSLTGDHRRQSESSQPEVSVDRDRRPSSTSASDTTYHTGTAGGVRGRGGGSGGATSSRRPRRTHEVIVIEDDDNDEDEEQKENERHGASAAAPPVDPPHMAPPDRVLEEEDRRVEQAVSQQMTEQASLPCDVVSMATNTNAAVPAEVVDISSSAKSHPATPTAATVEDLRVGSLLYVCFGGAPSLEMDWISMFAPLKPRDLVEAAEMLQFQLRHHQVFASYPPFLAHFVAKAMRVRLESAKDKDSSNNNCTSGDASRLDGKDVVAAFAKCVADVRVAWNQQLCDFLSASVNQFQEENNFQISMAPRPFASAPRLDLSHLAKYRPWATTQNQALAYLLSRTSKNLQSKTKSWQGLCSAAADADDVISPNVFVFFCLFEVVHFDLRWLRGRFCLTKFGQSVLCDLWRQVINKLPPFMDLDCAWLDEQSREPMKIPFLGIAQMVSSILISQSQLAQEVSLETIHEIISKSMKMLVLDSLLVIDGEKSKQRGQKDWTNDDSRNARLITMDGSQSIELEIPNLQWIQVVDLSGFLDIVQNVAPA